MDSEHGCALAPGSRRSRIAVPRAGSGSLPEYVSLRNSRDFRKVLSEGIRRRQGGIIMVSAPGPDGPPRLGLVVSKSCGSAVRRNRIKRRLRSAAGTVGLQPGIDYVIIATPELAETAFDRLTGWLARAQEDSARA